MGWGSGLQVEFPRFLSKLNAVAVATTVTGQGLLDCVLYEMGGGQWPGTQAVGTTQGGGEQWLRGKPTRGHRCVREGDE